MILLFCSVCKCKVLVFRVFLVFVELIFKFLIIFYFFFSIVSV